MKFVKLLLFLYIGTISLYGALTTSVSLDTGAQTAIYPTQETRLKINISNSAEVPITATSFHIDLPGSLPQGLKINSATTYTCVDGSGSVVTSGTLTAAINSTSLSLSEGTIPAKTNNVDGSCSIILPVTTESDSIASYEFTINSAAVRGLESGSPISNDGAVSQTINILALQPYTVQEVYSPSGNTYQNDLKTLTITVTNPNPVVIHNFSVTDSLDAYIKIASSPEANASCNNGGADPLFNPSFGDSNMTITGSLPENGVCTYTVNVKAIGTNSEYYTDSQNTLVDGGNDFNIAPVLNSANLRIYAAIDVSEYLKDRSTGTIALKAGDWETLTIDITNRSDNNLSNLAMDLPDHLRIGDYYGSDANDPMPRSLAFRNIQTSCNGTVDVDETTLRLSNGSLAGNSTCSITAEYTLFTQADEVTTYYIRGVIPAKVVTSDQNVYSESSTTHGAGSYLFVTTPLTISQTWKDVSGSPIGTLNVGNDGKLVITLANSGNDNITIDTFNQTSIDGNISGGLTIKNASTSCSGGSIITDAEGFSLSGGVIPASGTCSITLDFNTTLPSNEASRAFTNVITLGSVSTTDQLHISDSSTSPILTLNSILQSRIRYVLTNDENITIDTLTTGASGRMKIEIMNRSSDENISNVQLSLDPILMYDGNSSAANGLNISAANASTCSGATLDFNATGIHVSDLNLSTESNCTIDIDFTAQPQSGENSTDYVSLIKNSGTIGANNLLSGTVGGRTIIGSGDQGNLKVTDTIRLSFKQYPYMNSSSAGYTYLSIPGNPIKYILTIDNYDSENNLTNVTLSDTLPDGITFLNGTINGHDFNPTLSGTNCNTATSISQTDDTNASIRITHIDKAPVGSYSRCELTYWGMIETNATSGWKYSGSIYENEINAGEVCAGSVCNGGSVKAYTYFYIHSNPLSISSYFYGYSYSSGTYSTRSSNYANANVPTQIRLTLRNYSLNALEGVTLTGILPTADTGEQLKVAYPANFSTTCGTPSGSVQKDDTSISLTNLTIPGTGDKGVSNATGNCEVKFDVIGSTGIYDLNFTYGNLSFAYANDATPVPVSNITTTPKLTYTSPLSSQGTNHLTFTPNQIVSGRQSTVAVKIAASASGPVTVENIALNHALPSGITLAPSPNARSTCSGSVSISAVGGASAIAMDGARLDRGAYCYLYYDVQVDFPGAVGSTLYDAIVAGELTAENGDILGSTSTYSPYRGSITRKAAPSDNLLISLATNPSTLTFPGQVSQLTLNLTAGTTNLSQLTLPIHFTNDGNISGSVNGVLVAPNPQATTTCSNAQITANAESSTILLSGVSLTSGDTCSVTVNILSTDIGGKTITIPAHVATNDQGVTNANLASTSIAIASNIGVLKSFNPRNVSVNERSRMRITFYNPSPLPLTNLSLLDSLPSGLIVPPGASPFTTCTGGTISLPSTNQISIAGGSIAGTPENTTVKTCYAEIDVLATNPGEYISSIPIAGVTATVAGSSATNSVPTTDTLLVASPLEVNIGLLDSGSTYKTADINDTFALPTGWTTGIVSRKPGSNTTLKIHINNPNDKNLTNLSFNLSLPTGLLLDASPSATNTCGGSLIAQENGSYITLLGAHIQEQSSCEVSAKVISNTTGGTLTTTFATSNITTFEGITNAEPSSAVLALMQQPSLAMQFEPSSIVPGGISRLTLVLNNPNVTDITMTYNKTFTHTLPDGLTIAPEANMTTTCEASAVNADNNGTKIEYRYYYSSPSFSYNTPIPSGGCSISVNVTASNAGSYLNYIRPEQLDTSAGKNIEPASAVLNVSLLGFISGRVFNDNDVVANGTFEIGTDTPIPGTSISLYNSSDCSKNFEKTIETNELGVYTFNNLSPGTYSLCQLSQPVGTLNSITSAGTVSVGGLPGTASNGLSTSKITDIVLNIPNGSDITSGSMNNNFSEILLSSISGKVFIDINNNGLQNGSDIGISGQTIELWNVSNNEINSTTVTDSSGAYIFSSIAPGTYSIKQPLQPINTSNGQTIAGTVINGGFAGTSTTSSIIEDILLPPNTSAFGFNFAELSNNRFIAGQVFIDRNNDGHLSAGDLGIADQNITLSGTDINGNTINRNTKTDNMGSYIFSQLPEGISYTVTQPNQPSNTTNGKTMVGSTGGISTNTTTTPSAISSIDLSGDYSISAENNFAEIPDVAPDLTIQMAKNTLQFDVGGNAGQLIITPSNIGDANTSGETNISISTPLGMLVSSATGDDWNCTITGQSTTCLSNSIMAIDTNGSSITLIIDVNSSMHGQILETNATIFNSAEPPNFRSNNTVSLAVTILGTGYIGGTLWKDNDLDRSLDTNVDALVEGYAVHIFKDGRLIGSTFTDANGYYLFAGLIPGDYKLKFVDEKGSPVYGRPAPTKGTLTNGSLSVSLNAGNRFLLEDFPIPVNPTGIVYNAQSRNPVSGVELTITGPDGFDPLTDIVGGSATYTTSSDGHYYFFITSEAPSGIYTVAVSDSPNGYIVPSEILPVCTNTLFMSDNSSTGLVQATAVPPAMITTEHNASHCDMNNSSFPNNNTAYYASFEMNTSLSMDIFNNHIPIDSDITHPEVTSNISGATIAIDGNNTTTTTAQVNGMQIEVSTTQDKNQTHTLTLSNGIQTIAKFQIPGATTILDANGTITTTSQDGNITVVANLDGTAIHKVKFSDIEEDDYSSYGVSSHTTLAESKVMGAITTVSKDENNETQVKTIARMDLCDGTGYVEAIIITYETGESITRFYRYDTNDYLIASYETVLNGIFEPGNIDKIYEDSDDTCLKKINVRTKVRQTIGF